MLSNFNRKETLGRHRHRWEDNIIMDLKEIVINARNWVDSIEDREILETRSGNCIEPPGSISHIVS